MFHHPVSQASDRGLFIIRRCMVQHLRFFLSLAYQTLSQVNYLRDRRVCCASDSLSTPGTLACRILGVPCLPFRLLPLTQGFVVGGLLRIHGAFSGTLAWRVPGLLRLPLQRACLARIWRPLLFKVTCLLALLWRSCFTSDRLTGCVGQTSYCDTTFFSSTVSCRWSCC